MARDTSQGQARLNGCLFNQPAPSIEALLDEAPGAHSGLQGFSQGDAGSPNDWDVALAAEYKNHAAMDGLTAKNEVVRDKIMCGKQQAQQVAEKSTEIREVISSELGTAYGFQP